MSETIKISNGDIDINSETGKATLIDGPDKVSQDIAAVLLTSLQADRDWGCELRDLVFNTAFAYGAAEGLAAQKAAEAIRRLMTYQKKDDNITNDEQIRRIRNLFAKQTSARDIWLFIECELNTTSAITRGYLFQMDPVALNQQLWRV